MGGRNFAVHIGMNPSEYNRIEHGYVPFSTEQEWFDMICNALNLSISTEGIKDRHALKKLWEKPFVMQKVNADILISPFVHTSDGKPLTGEKMKELQEFLIEQAVDHNKKAKEYNKKNKNE